MGGAALKDSGGLGNSFSRGWTSPPVPGQIPLMGVGNQV